MSEAEIAGRAAKHPKGAKATSLNNRLLNAVKTGSVEDAERWIEDGANVRHIFAPREQNLVFHAADRAVASADGAEAKLAMLMFLIDKRGLEANTMDQLRQTPLFYAAKYEVEACKYLMEKRCDPSHLDIYQQQAIFYAARETQCDVVTLLLEHSGDAGQVDLSKRNALWYTRSEACIDVLIRGRADLNQQDTKGATVCDTATRHSALDWIQHLLSHRADLNLKDNWGRTCLDIAVKHQLDIAEALEELGAVRGNRQAFGSHNSGAAASGRSCGDPEMDDGATAVGFTAFNLYNYVRAGSYKDVLKVLSTHDSNKKYFKVNCGQGQNFMHLAAARQEHAKEVCELLTESNVDVDKEDDLKQTPLYFAVRQEMPDAFAGGVDCARLLLARRANPNHTDLAGDTPLYYAAQRPDSACVQALIDARADVSLRNETGFTAVHAAVWSSAVPNIVAMLNARCDPEVLDTQESPLFLPPHMKESVELLLAARCSPNRRDRNGRTPLMYAVGRRAADAARALIAGGADLSAQDNQGNTCLLLATMLKGNLDICRMLIDEFGCSPDVPNAEGVTAAQYLPEFAEERRCGPAEDDVMELEESPGGNGSAPSDRDRSRSPPGGRAIRHGNSGSGVGGTRAAATAESAAPPGRRVQGGEDAAGAPAPESPPLIHNPLAVKRKKYRMVFDDLDGNEIPYGTERYTRALRAFLRLHPWHDGWGLLQDSRPVLNVESGDEGDV